MTVKQLLKNNPNTIYRIGAKSGFMFIGNYADFIKYKNKINERYNYYHELHRFKNCYYKIWFNHCDKNLKVEGKKHPADEIFYYNDNTYVNVFNGVVNAINSLTDWHEYKPLENRKIISVNTYDDVNVVIVEGLDSGECLTDDEFIYTINTYSQTQLAMRLEYKAVDIHKTKNRDKIRKVKLKIGTEEDRYILLDENNSDIVKWNKFAKLSKI